MKQLTKDEAIEAWNTWRGRYKRPERSAFVKSNSSWLFPNPDQIAEIKNEIVSGKAGADQILFGNLTLLENGTFEVPWPRLLPFQSKIEGTSSLECFLLRVRWLYAIENDDDYTATVTNMLRSLDRDGRVFESFAKVWNEKLARYQLPPFGPRDLRGINLAGMDLVGDPYDGICLRHFDLSFAELSMAELDGANLYRAKLSGTSAINTNLRYAILSGVDCYRSMMSSADFSGSDLTGASFVKAICHRAVLDGARIDRTDISGAKFTKIVMHDECKSRKSSLSVGQLMFDSDTELSFAVPPSRLDLLPKQLLASNHSKETITSALISSVALRPGMFGISVDLKSLGEALIHRLWKSKKRQ